MPPESCCVPGQQTGARSCPQGSMPRIKRPGKRSRLANHLGMKTKILTYVSWFAIIISEHLGAQPFVRQPRTTELHTFYFWCRCHLPTIQQGDSVKAVIQSKVSAVIDSSKHVSQIVRLEPQIMPRGLSRSEAASYIGISSSLFDQMVRDGRMPKPIRIGSRVLWDKRELDEAFDILKDEPKTNSWDDA
jgi:excisionase family DNA binding protein